MTNATVQFDLYRFVAETIENSVTGYLVNRATKHVEWLDYEPEFRRRDLASDIAREVMADLCDWINFDPEREE